jgi:hypothetical protein
MNSKLPFWFRPYIWVPSIALLYIVIPLFVWDFSPHVLTHSMPYFLAGGSDWGGGNIFAFTKLAYWISLMAGAIVINRISIASQARTVRGLLLFTFRTFGWHGAAAIALAGTMMIGCGDSVTNVGNLWVLAAYLLAGAAAIVWTAWALEMKERRPWRLIACSAIGMLWGLAPVGAG